LKPVWQEIEAETTRILQSITIQDLAERERAGVVSRYAI
jgi:DNA-binding IscR family transcriptional regulator